MSLGLYLSFRSRSSSRLTSDDLLLVFINLCAAVNPFQFNAKANLCADGNCSWTPHAADIVMKLMNGTRIVPMMTKNNILNCYCFRMHLGKIHRVLRCAGIAISNSPLITFIAGFSAHMRFNVLVQHSVNESINQ